MDTTSYSTLLWRRKWIIVGTFLLTVLVVGVGTRFLTPSYDATATLRVRTAARGSVDWVDYDIAYTERLMNTYAELATSEPVLHELALRLGRTVVPAIQAEVLPDTELMTITAEGKDPTLVAEAANTLTSMVVSESADLYSDSSPPATAPLAEDLAQAKTELEDAQDTYAAALAESPQDEARIQVLDRAVGLKQEAYASLLSQYQRAQFAAQLRANLLSIVQLASVPTAPTSPNLVMNLVLGGMLGLVGGVGLAALFHKLDRRLYTEDEVEEVTRLPVLASVANSPHWRSVVLGDDAAHTPEMYHRARAVLDAVLRDGPNTLLITSAQPGEGKSMLARNLAIAMGQAGRRVVVVEANLHQPAVHENLDVDNELGLTTVVGGKGTLREAVQPTSFRGVWALTGGHIRYIPVHVFSSPRMAELLESLQSQFDVVLLDGPSVLGVADASVLAAMADGVVLVVSVGSTSRDAVEAAREQLSRMNARLLGVVVNRVGKTGDEVLRRYYDRAPRGGGEQRPAPVQQAVKGERKTDTRDAALALTVTRDADERQHEPAR